MLTYSKRNPPSGYYVYLYLREDGTPYYVGKGCGIRAWEQHRRNNKGIWTPKDLDRIVIPADNLLELWAFALEIMPVPSLQHRLDTIRSRARVLHTLHSPKRQRQFLYSGLGHCCSLHSFDQYIHHRS